MDRMKGGSIQYRLRRLVIVRELIRNATTQFRTLPLHTLTQEEKDQYNKIALSTILAAFALQDTIKICG